MSLPEYVDRINAIISRATQRYEVLIASPPGAVLVAEREQLAEFTPQDLQAALQGVGEIEDELKEAIDAIEPPEQVAELHHVLFDDRFMTAREALTARAGVAADWDELSETPEMDAYRMAVAGDKQACIDIQTELDATAERGVFADTPWIPADLQEVVDSLLGCDAFPEHPEDMWRPVPSSTP